MGGVPSGDEGEALGRHGRQLGSEGGRGARRREVDPHPPSPCTPARRKGLLTTATSEQGAVGCKRERDKGRQWGEAGGAGGCVEGQSGAASVAGDPRPHASFLPQQCPEPACQRGAEGRGSQAAGTQTSGHRDPARGRAAWGMSVWGESCEPGREPRGPQRPPVRSGPHPGSLQGGPGPWDWNQMEQMGDLSHRASVFLYVKWEDRPPYRLGVKVQEETGLSLAPPAPGPPPSTRAGPPATLSVAPCLAGCPLRPPHGAE